MWQELEAATDHLGNFLTSPGSGLQKGDRVLLVFFPGLDFSAALLACFKAEIIAVPVFPPDPRKLKKDLHHFVSIQSSSGAKIALTNSQFNFVKKVADIKNTFTSVKWPELKWIQIDDHLKKGRSKADGPTKLTTKSFPSLETIAFLQYTSGSTSEPKGVMISHQNLGHNLHLIVSELKANQSTVNVSWLPQYHDMGLIGSYLGVLYCGGSGYYLSPISFLKDPLVWIKALSQYHGTHTQVSSFTFIPIHVSLIIYFYW
jgi:acyl-CoA synthetase (AMP-forming)/AMP-acid ligase II